MISWARACFIATRCTRSRHTYTPVSCSGIQSNRHPQYSTNRATDKAVLRQWLPADTAEREARPLVAVPARAFTDRAARERSDPLNCTGMASPFRYVCILDFEATCDDVITQFPNEIVEFPSVLLRWFPGKKKTRQYEQVAEFQRYCKPVVNPTLNPFCTSLTGIRQEQVDAGVAFPDALQQHHAWLLEHCEGDLRACTIVTCGAWDLRTMLPRELQRWELAAPDRVYTRFLNIKTEAAKHFRWKNQNGMAGMLNKLEMELEGRHHSGIDDCRNIARIWQRLVAEGYSPTETSLCNVITK